MGHEVIYKDYPGDWDIKKIVNEVCNYVRHSGDRYGTDTVRVPTSKIFDNSDEANDFITKNDRYDYDGIAVKFYDYSGVKDTPKIAELRKKIAETVKKSEIYAKEHSVKNQKAAFIGCPSCHSKLNREKLRGELCPLCRADLRSFSTLERLQSFPKRIKEYNQKIEQEQKKEKSKAKIRWLVKFEYHT